MQVLLKGKIRMENKINLNIKEIAVNKLKSAGYNPRTFTDNQFNDLCKSLERFGMVEPVIVNSASNRKNIIIGGHFRLMVAKKLGFKKVPVIYLNIPNIEKEKELNIRLNKNVGEWDLKLLATFDEKLLENTGFEKELLNNIFQEAILSEKDELPEYKKTKIKTGDIFLLGRHRLMCGDCTIRENVDRLMDGKKADMVFTDPPYGVNYGADPDILNKKRGGKFKFTPRPIIGDNLTTEECAEKLWRPAFRNLYEFSADHCSLYMTMCQGGNQMIMTMMVMRSEHWQIKHELIWVKSSPVFSMGRLDYDYQHEPILFGWKKNHKFYGQGEFLKSVWEIPKPSKSPEHPTMKPIALMVNAILNSSQRGELVCDLFLGSGSTLIACEQTNRICYGMEIDPQYCQVIMDRWENYTKNKIKKIDK